MVQCASHGELDVQWPTRSALRLAPTASDDGRLTVDEIFNLRLDADLVVLSACSTGLGATLSGRAVAPGDELVGLSRAFLHAGARSVVVSLWPAADNATAQLMAELYRNLRSGRSKAEALQRAQSAMVARATPPGSSRDIQIAPQGAGDPARLAHPFYWAGFVLVGDGN